MAESRNDLTLTALSEKLGLAPSTMHRLLALLIKEGLVGRDPATKTYYCAAEFVRIASLVLGASRIADLADPILRSLRSEEHTSELQSLMRISYAVFCLKKKKHQTTNN